MESSFLQSLSPKELEARRAENPNYDAEVIVKEWIDTLNPDTTSFPTKSKFELPNAQLICRALNVMVLELTINLRSRNHVFLRPEEFRQAITSYYQEKMDRRYNRDVAIAKIKVEVRIQS
jgi:hypothetical protein